MYIYYTKTIYVYILYQDYICIYIIPRLYMYIFYTKTIYVYILYQDYIYTTTIYHLIFKVTDDKQMFVSYQHVNIMYVLIAKLYPRYIFKRILYTNSITITNTIIYILLLI